MPATVGTFLENTKALEALKEDGTITKELEVSLGIIRRAFPTITEDILMKLEMDQIRAISDTALGLNGEVAGTDEPSAEGNVPKAE